MVLQGSSAFAIDHAEPCLPLEPTEVRLEGTIRREKFEDANGRLEDCRVIHLLKPICVEKGDGEFLSENVTTDTIQLVLYDDARKVYRSLVNKLVTARGTLFPSHTAHHHTPVLLSVIEIQEIDK